MLSMILTVTLMNVRPAVQTAQFQPCVWPNRCVETPVQTAQFSPCVWPNKCAVSTKA